MSGLLIGLHHPGLVLFWSSAALLVFGYAGYPLTLWCLSRLFGRPRNVPPLPLDEELPTVSMLISAFNEEAVIGARIRDALETDYPPDRFEIVIASDGSTDATARIVRRYQDRGVRFLEYSRRGKWAVLNTAMNEVSGQVVVLSDANTSLDIGAVRRLVRWFADPNVGAVCGRLVLLAPDTADTADGSYWAYETFLKQCEDRLGGLLGSNGAIYAIRRSLYVPIPGTSMDDLLIPLLAKLHSDCQIVYDPEAVAWENAAPEMASDFRRRARFGASGYQSMALLWKLLNPRRGWIAFTFLSHKVLRWLSPFFLLGMLVGNVFLLSVQFYRYTLAAQLLCYATAATLFLGASRLRVPRLFRIPASFVAMNAALLVGFWRWVRRERQGIWVSTARSMEVHDVEATVGA